MKIGILQCGHLEERLQKIHGGFADMFAALLAGHGFEFENFVVVDGQFPSSIDACQGWLVTGSVHGVYDELEWIAPLEEFIRRSHAKDIAIVGICFGHQVMAQAFGGKVVKYPGGTGIGLCRYLLEDGNADLLALHQDQVVEISPKGRIIASSQFCAHAGLAYGSSALSFQPHPEFTPEFMRDLINYKMETGLSRAVGDAALEKIDYPNDSVLIASWIAEFYKKFARRAQTYQAAE